MTIQYIKYQLYTLHNKNTLGWVIEKDLGTYGMMGKFLKSDTWCNWRIFRNYNQIKSFKKYIFKLKVKMSHTEKY